MTQGPNYLDPSQPGQPHPAQPGGMPPMPPQPAQAAQAPQAGQAAQAPQPATTASGGAAMQLQPPNQALSLEAPEAPPVVQAQQASSIAPPVTDEQRPVLDEKVDQYVETLLSQQPGSPEYSSHADAIRSMGDNDIRRAAEMSNRLLEVPIREMESGGVSDVSQVSNALTALRKTVEELDPNQPKQRKFLGIIPFGDKIENYFRKYQSSQQHINAILHALRSGQDELAKDNVSLNMEKQQLWDTMSRLNQYIYMAEQLDAKLSATIAELQVTDFQRADALNKDVLFYVRQKHQDLLTQLAVSIQGYLALDVIIKNNLELIKGVDRASTTTISALRTAVLTAQALGTQTLVLDQVTALNDTTSNLIASTSEMLRDNSVTIQQQAANSTVSLDALRQAFANIYDTMDSIDHFKLEALNTMSETIGVLETEVAKSRHYLQRARDSEARSQATFDPQQGSSLDLGT